MWIVLIGAALAGEWLVESDDFADRARLEVVQAVGQNAGLDAQIVRRYVEPGVWVYVAQVDGFADASSARVAAATLADRTGLRMAVLDRTTSATLDRIVPTGAAADEAGRALVRAVLDAHGSGPSLFEQARRGPVRFVYRRTLADGMVVDHTWEARDGAVYCRADVVEGEGKSSVTRIVGPVAEMSVKGGPFQRVDLEQVRAIVESMGPAEVIPMVLALGPATANRHDFRGLAAAGRASADKASTDVLRFAGDATSPSLELQVGVDDHLIRQINWRDGAIVHELSDYHVVHGVPVPFEILTARADGHGDRVQVRALEFGGQYDATHFRLVSEVDAR